MYGLCFEDSVQQQEVNDFNQIPYEYPYQDLGYLTKVFFLCLSPCQNAIEPLKIKKFCEINFHILCAFRKDFPKGKIIIIGTRMALSGTQEPKKQ